MLTQEEMKERFDSLYDYMARSNEPKYMYLFGEVMKEMMDWFIHNKADAAQSWIDMLGAIKWEQYLTKSEATKIYNAMMPKGVWPYDAWKKAMGDLGLSTEREYVFNEYALWVVMNAENSDNSDIIAELLGIQPSDVTNAKYIKTIYRFAVNKLTDADGFYSVREQYLK